MEDMDNIIEPLDDSVKRHVRVADTENALLEDANDPLQRMNLAPLAGFVPGTPPPKFSVRPPLPKGLVLDGASGIISGSPEEDGGAATKYVVTATNDVCSPSLNCNCGGGERDGCYITLRASGVRLDKTRLSTAPLRFMYRCCFGPYTLRGVAKPLMSS